MDLDSNIKKQCITCGIEKDISDFNIGKNQCKECRKIKKKEYYKIHSDKIKIYQKRYYKSNDIEINKRNKKYYELNIEKINKQRKEYREKNKIIIKKQKREYRINNIEECLLSSIYSRAKKNSVFCNLTEEDLKNKRPKDDICPLLGIKMKTNKSHQNGDSLSVDRIYPDKGYCYENIQLVSYKANSSKNNATIFEYEKIINNLNTLKIIESDVLKYIEADISKTIKNAKNRSKKLKLHFNINDEYLNAIYPADNICPLLNVIFVRSKFKFNDFSPTLDRIIPEKGYVKGNVVFVSFRANLIKNNLTLDEMKLLLSNWKKIIGVK